jgi:toxin ParE1/3/4
MNRAKFQVAPRARADVAEILEWSRQNYGPDAAHRYAATILHCFDVIEAEPLDCSYAFSDATPAIRIVHLRTVAISFRRPGGRVKRPRHVVLFRVFADSRIEISRVLHERMNFDQHLSAMDDESATDE